MALTRFELISEELCAPGPGDLDSLGGDLADLHGSLVPGFPDGVDLVPDPVRPDGGDHGPEELAICFVWSDPGVGNEGAEVRQRHDTLPDVHHAQLLPERDLDQDHVGLAEVLLLAPGDLPEEVQRTLIDSGQQDSLEQ